MAKIDIALTYAKRGWSVLALTPNSKIPLKHDLQKNGSKDATTDEEKITIIWAEFPDANIGIATGKNSNLTVLDLDDKAAITNLKDLGYKIPNTYIVKTKRGYHVYYQYDETIQQSQGRVDKCDIRNDGGYVVAAGSTIDDFEYTIHGQAKDLLVCDLPEIFKKSAQPVDKDWVNSTGKKVPEGRRNDALFRYACLQRTNKNLSETDIAALVNKYNQEHLVPPLPTNEVIAIIQSASKYSIGSEMNLAQASIQPPMIEKQTDRKATFFWQDENIKVEVTNINYRYNNIYCRLEIKQDSRTILNSNYSLYNEDSKSKVWKMLRDLDPTKNWLGILLYIQHHISEHTERDGELVDLVRHKPSSDNPYLIFPLIRKKQATVIYADGGSGKSTMALTIASSLATGKSLIEGIEPINKNGVNVLYLDWETTEDDHSMLIDAISEGAKMQFPFDKIIYKNMSGAFIDRVDSIVDDIVKNNIELVIVDSIVGSAGSDVNEAESARLYFQALRSLNIASLGITHTNKQGGLFGTTFFRNLARQVYVLESVQRHEENPVVALIHDKHNMSQKQPPMVYQTQYEGTKLHTTSISYKKIDIQEVPELAKHINTRDRIIYCLKKGDKDAEEISKELNLGISVIESTLRVYTNNFKKVGDTWTLENVL
tara:strand:- start:8201 stop:10165 length:1965 start_codon:yes stop_codon:yes gene_type:complete